MIWEQLQNSPTSRKLRVSRGCVAQPSAPPRWPFPSRRSAVAERTQERRHRATSAGPAAKYSESQGLNHKIPRYRLTTTHHEAVYPGGMVSPSRRKETMCPCKLPPLRSLAHASLSHTEQVTS